MHGFLGETEIVVDLRADDDVGLASRKDAIRPAKAKAQRRTKDSSGSCRTLRGIGYTLGGNACLGLTE